MVEPMIGDVLPKINRLSISKRGAPVLPTVSSRPPLRSVRRLNGNVVPTLSMTASTPRFSVAMKTAFDQSSSFERSIKISAPSDFAASNFFSFDPITTTRRAKIFCDLYAGGIHASARADNCHCLPGMYAPALDHRMPCGLIHQCRGRSGVEIKIVWQFVKADGLADKYILRKFPALSRQASANRGTCCPVRSSRVHICRIQGWH